MFCIRRDCYREGVNNTARGRRLSRTGLFGALLALGVCAMSNAEPIRVRHMQGSAHGFLEVTDLDGEQLAVGDVTQRVKGYEVTARMTLHFLDGSLDDDTTVFSQRDTFHLLSDHHVQKGPSFPKPIDVTIETPSQSVKSRDENGMVKEEHLDMPPDTSNGLPPNLLMNMDPSSPLTTIAFVAPGSKARLVHLVIKKAGDANFTVGKQTRKAVDYSVHVDLGGVVGAVAPVIGKQPPDYHIWILPGADPAFIREEGPLYEGGPIRRIQQVSPAFGR